MDLEHDYIDLEHVYIDLEHVYIDLEHVYNLYRLRTRPYRDYRLTLLV